MANPDNLRTCTYYAEKVEGHKIRKRSNNPTRTTPWVNYGLIAVNIVVFVYAVMLSPNQLEQLFQTFAVVPEQLTASFQQGNLDQLGGESLTLISSQFLHGGFLHLGGNMLFLWVFGRLWGCYPLKPVRRNTPE